MNQQNGYYSLIQFCPDLSRLEGINVGVVVYSLEEKCVRVRISHDNSRIRKSFGKQDWTLLNRAKLSIQNQLLSQLFVTVEDLHAYIAKRANFLQLTPLRSMSIANIDSDVRALYDRLVGSEAAERRRRIDWQLGKKLQDAGVTDFVQKSVQVEIPNFNKSIRVPFAYQNGRYNLISPVMFEPEAILAQTGKCALEGQFLYGKKHSSLGDMRLVVVANFDDQIEKSTRDLVKTIFEEHSVMLYSFENLDPLVDDIKRSAAIHAVHKVS